MLWDIEPFSMGQLSWDRPGLNLPQARLMSWDVESFSVGQLSQDGPSLHRPEDDSDFTRLKTLSDQAITRIAAACDKLNIKHEREFQSAQNHKMITGEHLPKTDSNC